MSKALLLDFFIKASEAGEEEARVQKIRAYQDEHAVCIKLFVRMRQGNRSFFWWGGGGDPCLAVICRSTKTALCFHEKA